MVEIGELRFLEYVRVRLRNIKGFWNRLIVQKIMQNRT